MSNEIKNLAISAAEIIDELAGELEAAPHGKYDAELINRAYQTSALLSGGGYVYVLVASSKDKNLVKIGRTGNLKDRVSQLTSQVGTKMPFTVSLGLAVISTDDSRSESELHEEFKQFRANGEWFEVPSLLDVYKSVIRHGHGFGRYYFDAEVMRISEAEVRGFAPPVQTDAEEGYNAMSHVCGLVGGWFPGYPPDDVTALFTPAMDWWESRVDEERRREGLKTYKELRAEAKEPTFSEEPPF